MGELDYRFPTAPTGSVNAPAATTPNVGPGKRALTDNMHTQPASAFRNPTDEAPMEINNYIQIAPPSQPFQPRDVVPPPGCPMPPNATRERAATHHETEQHLTNRHELDPPILLTSTKLETRQAAWDAYREVSLNVMAMQTRVAPQLAWFQDAAHAELSGTGLVLPKGFHGTVANLADRQEVPQRGGRHVSSLFGADNHAALTAKDNATLSTTDVGVMGIVKTDKRLQAALERTRAAAFTVSATAADIRSCVKALELANAKERQGASEVEIADLKEVLRFIAHGPEEVGKILANLANPGTACAMVFSVLSIAGLSKAETALKQVKREVHNAELAVLTENLEGAKMRSLAAVRELSARRLELDAAAAERREAYDAVGKDIGNPDIAASLSAIQAVEVVVANAKIIVNQTRDARPHPDPQVAVGFGIAVHHGLPEAQLLPAAIGTLEFCNTYYSELWLDWNERLSSLNAMKQSLTGDREGSGVARNRDEDSE